MSMDRWRNPVLFSLGSLLLIATGASADPIRITSVDGNYNTNHVTALSVRVGDRVDLTADLINPSSGQPERVPAEDFIWSADDSSSDVLGQAGSNFQFNNYGIDFFVPYGNWQRITIVVRTSFGNSGVDSISLINESFVAPQPFPPQPPRPQPLPPQPAPRPPQPAPQPPRPAPVPQPPQPAPQPPRPAPAPVPPQPAPAPQPQPPHPVQPAPGPSQPQPGQPHPGGPHPMSADQLN
jgi:hypothetical protein